MSDGYIVVLDPAEWTGEGTRSVAQPVGRSLRIRGLAFHPSGVTSVHVNGHRAITSASGDSGVIEFTVFLPVAQGTEEAFIVAAPNSGSPLILSRSLDLLPAEALEEGVETSALARFEGVGSRWAVVIGLSAYEDETIPSLRFAHRDAEALRDFLISERAGIGGFDPEKVVLLTNEEATFRNIRTALRGFLTSATEQDQIVFYFAGHGVRDPQRPSEYYLLTHDTDFGNLAGTALPMSDLEQSVAQLKYRDLIFLADACHSGEIGVQVAFRDAFAFNDINDVFRERLHASRGGEVVFTAGEGGDLSQEGERWGGGHGVFTYHLLRGLEGAADANGDGLVELGEVLEHVRDQVRRDTGNAQNPAISGGTFDRYLPMAIVLPSPPELDPVEFQPFLAVPSLASGSPEVREIRALSEIRRSFPNLPPVRGPSPLEASEPEPLAAPPFTPEGALGRGVLIPGLGQLHTGRALGGGLVIGAAAGGVFLAFRSGTQTESRTFQGPFGSTYEEEVRVRGHPHRNLGIGIAAAAMLAGAVEAYLFARRHETGIGAPSIASMLQIIPHHGEGGSLQIGLRLPSPIPGF